MTWVSSEFQRLGLEEVEDWLLRLKNLRLKLRQGITEKGLIESSKISKQGTFLGTYKIKGSGSISQAVL